MEAKAAEIQKGVDERMQDAGVDKRTRSGVLDYMKAGFGVVLGALLAIILVDLVVDGRGSPRR